MRDVNLCLEQATVCQQESESDVDGDTAGAREEDMEEVHAGLPPQLRVTEEQRSHQSEVRLAAAGTELEAAQTEVCSAQRELKKLEPRLSFSPKLPTSVLLTSWVSSERQPASALRA